MSEAEIKSEKMALAVNEVLASESIKSPLCNAYQRGWDNGIEAAQEIKDKAYWNGASDTWELVKKIVKNEEDGGLSYATLREIYGDDAYRAADIVDKYQVYEAFDRIKVWNAQKEAESKNPYWKKVYRDGSIDWVYQCSECGAMSPNDRKHAYCPSCGVKMVVESDESL